MGARSLPVLALVACAFEPMDRAAPGAMGKADSSAEAPCGSALGDQVSAAARAGRSPIQGIETTANRVVGGPVVGTQAIGDKMNELIRSAKHEVLLQVMVFEGDTWLASRIIQAVDELPSSVQVRVHIRPNGGPPLIGENSAEAAARVKSYLPHANVVAAGWDTPDRLGLELLHSKTLIIDGQVAFVFDSNIEHKADPIAHQAEFPGALEWYQQGIVVEGDAAHALRREFAQAWTSGLPASDMPPAPPAQPVNACTRAIVAARDAGAGRDASANQAYATLFTGARQVVRAITPNLNDDQALDALAQATADSDVFLILSLGFNDVTENLPGFGGTNQENVWRLADMAVDPCRLHIAWFAVEPSVAIEGNTAMASHAKWASADGQVMIQGSQNLDTQAWKNSREVNLVVDDQATTAGFDAVFDELWSRTAVAYECR